MNEHVCQLLAYTISVDATASIYNMDMAHMDFECKVESLASLYLPLAKVFAIVTYPVVGRCFLGSHLR